MKKILLLLLVCVLGNVLAGQGSLVMNPMNGQDNMVRYDAYSGFHVSCSQQGSGDVHFALTDFNMLIDVWVATGLKVNDFEIIDRLVFFCGENSVGSTGFLGWFDIDSLFYYGGNAHIDLSLSSLGLISLDNIELYHDQGGSIHVAGYGKAPFIPAPTPPASCYPPCLYLAFEAVGSLSAGMQYRVLELQEHACFSEVVDMAVTENYVVYLERIRSHCYNHYGIGVMLQPFPKYYMFPTPPYPFFYFQTTDNHAAPAGSATFVVPYEDDPCSVPPRITHTIEDEVAVCSYRRDFDFTTWSQDETQSCGGDLFFASTPTNLAIRTYDFGPLLTNNPVPMTNAFITPLTPGDGKSIDGFRYDNQKGYFVALHRHETSSGVLEHAVTSVNYTTGLLPAMAYSYYQTTFNTKDHWIPCSLCLTIPDEYTVGGFFKYSGNNEYIFWHDFIVNPVTGNCDAVIKSPMKSIPTMVAKEEINPNVPTSWNPLNFEDVIPTDRVDSQCSIICN